MAAGQGPQCHVRRHARMRRRIDETHEHIRLGEGPMHGRYRQPSDLQYGRGEIDCALPSSDDHMDNMPHMCDLRRGNSNTGPDGYAPSEVPHLSRLSHASLMRIIVLSEHEVFPRLHLHVSPKKWSKLLSLASQKIIPNVTPGPADCLDRVSRMVVTHEPPGAAPTDLHSLGYDQIVQTRFVYSGDPSSMSEEMGGASHRAVSPARDGRRAMHSCCLACQPSEPRAVSTQIGMELVYKRADGKVVTRVLPGA